MFSVHVFFKQNIMLLFWKEKVGQINVNLETAAKKTEVGPSGMAGRGLTQWSSLLPAFPSSHRLRNVLGLSLK